MVRNFSDNDFIYFILIAFVFKTILPFIYIYFNCPQLYYNLFFIMGESAVLYPIVGYYLANRDLSRRDLAVITSVSVISIVLGTYKNYNLYLNAGGYLENGYLPSVLPVTVFIFSVVKYIIIAVDKKRTGRGMEGIKKIISVVSQCTFGIYFLSDFFLISFREIAYKMNNYMPALVVTVIYLFAVIFCGTICTMIIKKIPGLKDIV